MNCHILKITRNSRPQNLINHEKECLIHVIFYYYVQIMFRNNLLNVETGMENGLFQQHRNSFMIVTLSRGDKREMSNIKNEQSPIFKL